MVAIKKKKKKKSLLSRIAELSLICIPNLIFKGTLWEFGHVTTGVWSAR